MPIRKTVVDGARRCVPLVVSLVGAISCRQKNAVIDTTAAVTKGSTSSSSLRAEADRLGVSVALVMPTNFAGGKKDFWIAHDNQKLIDPTRKTYAMNVAIVAPDYLGSLKQADFDDEPGGIVVAEVNSQDAFTFRTLGLDSGHNCVFLIATTSGTTVTRQSKVANGIRAESPDDATASAD